MTAQCPRCCAPIPADGPQGLCPKCLLAVGMGEPEVIRTASGEPAPPPPDPAEIAPHFPQLEVVRVIGRGGMGAVYEARQKGLQRTVALKILSAPSAADASFEERFVREAQALARLSHENIVAVYDAGRAGPHFYLLMEYVDGPNLRQALKAGRIEPAQSLALVMQICQALEYAHRNGVVHRDIKPENVLLTRAGQVKIADFGLAKVLDRAARGLTLTRASQAMGTPHYMAPEQIEHPQQVDHRADIYSLGVVLYELLTGELPLGRFPLPSQRVQVDVRLDDIVLRTLEKEPERRYQAASEVRTAVHEVATTPPPMVPPAVPVGAGVSGGAPRKRRVWPWVVGALVLLLLVIPLIGFASMFLFLAPGQVAGEQVGVASSAPPPVAMAPDAPPPPEAPVHTALSGPWVPGGARPPRDPAAERAWERGLQALETHGASLRARYLRLEEEATVLARVSGRPQVVDVTIEAFEQARGELAAELWTLLTNRLGTTDAARLMNTGFEWQVLPFGEATYDVSVRETGPGWTVVVQPPAAPGTLDRGAVMQVFEGPLPDTYQRILERGSKRSGGR